MDKKFADFFEPRDEDMKEALIFCAHKTIPEYVYYMHDTTIAHMIKKEDELDKFFNDHPLDALEDEIFGYSQKLIDNLEYWEEYEICDAVLFHRNWLIEQLNTIKEKYDL